MLCLYAGLGGGKIVVRSNGAGECLRVWGGCDVCVCQYEYVWVSALSSIDLHCPPFSFIQNLLVRTNSKLHYYAQHWFHLFLKYQKIFGIEINYVHFSIQTVH